MAIVTELLLKKKYRWDIMGYQTGAVHFRTGEIIGLMV